MDLSRRFGFRRPQVPSNSPSLLPSHQARNNRDPVSHFLPFQIGQDAQPPSWSEDNTYSQNERGHAAVIDDVPDPSNIELDDYDVALLAEPTRDRQWQATHGLGRLSLPPRNLTNQPTQSHREARGIQENIYVDQCRLGEHSTSTATHFVAAQTPRQGRRLHQQGYSPAIFLTPSPATSSSPLAISHSSPSFLVSERRKRQGRQRVLKQDKRPVEPTKANQSIFGPLEEEDIISKNVNGRPPTVQGIQLVPTHDLPDRFRSLFHFKVFNAVQSKCFDTAYRSDDNMVLSAPTGSGKTAVLELAICRLLLGADSQHYKIVYMAPTKSLCAERYKSWKSRFSSLGLIPAELTGDTDSSKITNVQSASIIITTPEKWDSMTRKWKDHERLIQLIKLFLIDEVHILKDARGATLEAVVSRMKSVGSGVRFVALSATIPNSEDVAIWLGLNDQESLIPAQREVFSENFRPVKLQKHVLGISWKGNDFGFDQICDQKLPEIISKFSARKPVLIFCCTRRSTVTTAKALAASWTSASPLQRQWQAPAEVPSITDYELRELVSCGIAAHHAGLGLADRAAVEDGYLKGIISVICCTSTLAVGVNLPCHLVIIKNTVTWQSGGLKEYADLEMMQMLGRAGRPQFDNSAVAVIVTKQEKVKRYERLISGEEILESCLHLNLIDHLNAEIGLGTVKDLSSAKTWLSGTFLYVRLKKNPHHYKIGNERGSPSLEETVEWICEREIDLLHSIDLIRKEPFLQCTSFGDAMTRYYVKFETMRNILEMPQNAKVSEILSVLAQAEEFQEIRFRSGEKSLYKAINNSQGMRFPIKVDLSLAAHKRSIIIQSELGSIEYPAGEQYGKYKTQYLQDKGIMFTNIHRLIRCIADCKLHLKDAPGIRSALELSRSLGARVWDSSPLQMKQIPNIGPVAVRKLALAGIANIETLEATEPHRINSILGKQHGFAETLLHRLRDFPKVYISVKFAGLISHSGQLPVVKFDVNIGFMNEKVPQQFNKKPVYMCFLAERSDGYLINFKRQVSSKVGKDEIRLSAEILNASQKITCFAMCDEIAGSLRSAELHPEIPLSAFPNITAQVSENETMQIENNLQPANIKANRQSFRRTSDLSRSCGDLHETGIEDQDLIHIADSVEFPDIEDIEREQNAMLYSNSAKHKTYQHQDNGFPERLENGKWKCNHKCKDKTACKHLCCREGIDNPTKRAKGSSGNGNFKDGCQGASKSKSLSEKVFKPVKPSASITPQASKTKQQFQPLFDPRASVEHNSRERFPFNGPHSTTVQESTNGLKHCEAKPSENTSSVSHAISKRSRKAIKLSSDDFDSDWMNDLPSLSTMLDKHAAVNSRTPTTPKQSKTKSLQAPKDNIIDLEIEDFDQPIFISSSSRWSLLPDEIENVESQNSTHQSTANSPPLKRLKGSNVDDSQEVDACITEVDSQTLDQSGKSAVKSPFFKQGEKRKRVSADSDSPENIPRTLPTDTDGNTRPLTSSIRTGNAMPTQDISEEAKPHDPWEGIDPWIRSEYEHLVEIID